MRRDVMKAATLEKKTHVTKARHLTELIRQIQKRLRFSESDKVMRYSRLLHQATDFFGDIEKARAWLKHPQYGLGGAVPLDYATTETGAREVVNLLGRMKYGVYS